MEKIIIAAVSKNNVIGVNGKIPWKIKDELIHFKNTTIGYPVIMGRKTWDSLIQPLGDRINIILTRNTDFSFSHPNVVICNSIMEALSYSEKMNYQKIFIIGGQKVFEEFLPIADKMIISEIKMEVEGDCFFPTINPEEWQLNSTTDNKEFKVIEYIRKK